MQRSLADSRVFVVYQDTLYFLGRPPKGPVGLFALSLAKPAVASLVTNVLLPTPTGASPISLADRPLAGGLVAWPAGGLVEVGQAELFLAPATATAEGVPRDDAGALW